MYDAKKERTAQKIKLTADLWDQIRARAAKEVRSISNQIEYDLKQQYKNTEAEK